MSQFLCVMAGVFLVGCGGEDPIREYSVAKFETEPPTASSAGNQVWFFKLMGPRDGLLPYLEPFIGFLRATTFPDGQPEFEVPAGWTVKDGPPPRFKTLTVADSDPPIEVTVSALPAPPSDFSSYLLSNVNRWRGQVNMPPLEPTNWAERATQNQELITVEKGDQVMSVVQLNGTTEEFGDTLMLVAVISDVGLAAAKSETRPAETMSPPARSSSNVGYDKPENWEESAGNAMRLVSLRTGSSDETADVSVIRLPGGGDRLANINRWRGQVKLEPITQAELDEAVEELEIAGMSSQLILIEGETESILAAIAEKDGVKWFYKMQGPTEVVKAEQGRFREFLDSVRLDQDEE
ncbi:hypothetical protein AB1L42_22205 [Thalassoglobus sp. JC818]|uniref:hypothetical protein n=1 Tax=Thalassoglobus sp. JC818 TaxID=3232136 RepID=UPI003457CCF1